MVKAKQPASTAKTGTPRKRNNAPLTKDAEALREKLRQQQARHITKLTTEYTPSMREISDEILDSIAQISDPVERWAAVAAQTKELEYLAGQLFLLRHDIVWELRETYGYPVDPKVVTTDEERGITDMLVLKRARVQQLLSARKPQKHYNATQIRAKMVEELNTK